MKITAEMDSVSVELLRQSLFQKFWRKLSEELKQMEQGKTQEFDKVLAQWLTLERAIQRNPSENPSFTADPRLHAAWEKLTAPENARTLEDLFYQLSDPRQIELAAEALKECRRRVTMGGR